MAKKKLPEEIIEEVKVALPSIEIPSDVVSKICAENGVTLETLCETLGAGLKARRMTLDKYGEEHYEEDFGNQHKYMMTALELLKYVKSPGVNVQVVNISVEERELLDAYKRGI